MGIEELFKGRNLLDRRPIKAQGMPVPPRMGAGPRPMGAAETEEERQRRLFLLRPFGAPLPTEQLLFAGAGGGGGGFGGGGRGAPGPAGPAGAAGAVGPQGPGGGGGGAECATVVVNADGTADATTIAGGIALLPAGGGLVCVREGTYAIAATIAMPDKPVVIEGTGDATIIDLGASAIAAFSIPDTMTAYRKHVFSKFRVTGTAVAGQTFLDYGDSDSFAEEFVDLVRTNGIRTVLNISLGGGSQARVHFTECNFVPTASTPNRLVNDPTVTTQSRITWIFFDHCKTFDHTGTVPSGGWSFSTDSSIILNECHFYLENVANTTNEFIGVSSAFDNVSGAGGNPTWTTQPSPTGFGAGSAFVDFNHKNRVDWTFDADADIIGSFFIGTVVANSALFIADSLFQRNVTFNAASLVSNSTFSATTTDTINVTASGCVFDGCTISNGLAATGSCIDLSAAATRCVISNCRFSRTGVGISAAGGIAIASTGNAISGCNFFSGFSANSGGLAGIPCIVETGIADHNRISGIGFGTYTFSTSTQPFTIIGVGTVVEGVRRFNSTGSTVDALTTLFEHRATKGITGVGTIKNTGGANSLDVEEQGIDFFGVTGTVTTAVAALAEKLLDPQVNIGTARPPYARYRVRVRSTVAGMSTTFSIQHADQGVE